MVISPSSSSCSISLELLEPDAQVAGLGVDLRRGRRRSRPRRLGVLLLPPRLVRGGHRLLEAGEDRLERDPLLALQLAERRDHLLAFMALLPFSSSSQSTTVRADAMSVVAGRAALRRRMRSRSPPRRPRPARPRASLRPSDRLAPSSPSPVCPTLRRSAAARGAAARSRASSPRARTGLRREPLEVEPSGDLLGTSAEIVSRSTPPVAVHDDPQDPAPASRRNATSTSSSPAASTTGRTSASASTRPNPLFERKVGASPLRVRAPSAAQYTARASTTPYVAAHRARRWPSGVPQWSRRFIRRDQARLVPAVVERGCRARDRRPRPPPRLRTRREPTARSRRSSTRSQVARPTCWTTPSTSGWSLRTRAGTSSAPAPDTMRSRPSLRGGREQVRWPRRRPSARGAAIRSPVARSLRSAVPASTPSLPDHDLHRVPDQVRVGELHPRALVAVVERHVHARRRRSSP